jgi:hypothetical protein
MDILSFFKSRAPMPRPLTADDVNPLIGSAYVSEYLMAIDRTEAFGFEAPPQKGLRGYGHRASRIARLLR